MVGMLSKSSHPNTHPELGGIRTIFLDIISGCVRDMLHGYSITPRTVMCNTVIFQCICMHPPEMQNLPSKHRRTAGSTAWSCLPARCPGVAHTPRWGSGRGLVRSHIRSQHRDLLHSRGLPPRLMNVSGRSYRSGTVCSWLCSMYTKARFLRFSKFPGGIYFKLHSAM